METFKKLSLLKESESITSYNTNMKTIKIIDYKTIEVDGVIFVPQEKPEFKVGQWIIGKSVYFPATPALITWIEGPKFSVDNFSGHIQINDSWIIDGIVLIRPAATSEIESHLRSICDKYVGKKTRSLCSRNEYKVTKFYKYFEHGDSLQYYTENEACTCIVYEAGKFAEILPDLKKKPETREEYEEMIQEYFNQNSEIPFATPVNEFLNQYSW